MTAKKKNECYIDLLDKLDVLEFKIVNVKHQLEKLRNLFSNKIDEEVCKDEVDADKAAYEAIHDTCLGALLEVKPKGDA